MRSPFKVISLSALAVLAVAAAALAQVPPHQPGTICLTPDFWCWAAVAGQPGTPCVCGDVAGIYG